MTHGSLSQMLRTSRDTLTYTTPQALDSLQDGPGGDHQTSQAKKQAQGAVDYLKSLSILGTHTSDWVTSRSPRLQSDPGSTRQRTQTQMLPTHRVELGSPGSPGTQSGEGLGRLSGRDIFDPRLEAQRNTLGKSEEEVLVGRRPWVSGERWGRGCVHLQMRLKPLG